MSWLYSRALVEEYSEGSCLDGELSVLLKSSHTHQAFCSKDKMTDYSHLSQFGMMFAPLTENLGADLLTLFLAGSRVKTLAVPEKEQGLTEKKAVYGENLQGSFSRFDPDTSSWKTRQGSLIEGCLGFSETWPKWGTMLNGVCYLREKWEPFIKGKECGFLPLFKLPTPCAGTSHWGGTFQEVGGSQNPLRSTWLGRQTVNPGFWEDVMGWPVSWTDLKPLEMDNAHSVQQKHL